MLTTDRRLGGIFGRLLGRLFERTNYDCGCGPIEMPEPDMLQERLVCEGDLPSLPRRPGHYRAFGR